MLLAFEKEMLGLYISDHPLLGVERTLRRATTCTISGLWDQQDGTQVTIGGLVSGVNRRFTRKGDPMVFFNLEDLDGTVEVVAFPANRGRLRATHSGGRNPARRAGAWTTEGDDVKMRASEIKEPDLHVDRELRLQSAGDAAQLDRPGGPAERDPRDPSGERTRVPAHDERPRGEGAPARR